MLIATEYNSWDMTNESIADKEISNLLLKKNNKYKDLFNSKRKAKSTSFLIIQSLLDLILNHL